MRNIAFLGAGLVLLLLRANLFRVLDREGIAVPAVLAVGAVAALRAFVVKKTSFVRWTLLILFGFGLMFGLLGIARATGLTFNLPGFVPSLVLPLIVFMGVHEFSLARGAAVAFVLGYATDLIGVAPVGLYTFTYVATFVLARAAGVRLAAQTMWMQALLAVAFTLVHSVMILVLMAIFGRDKDAWVPRQLYPLALPHALAEGLVAPLIFRLAQRIQTATTQAPRPEPEEGAREQPPRPALRRRRVQEALQVDGAVRLRGLRNRDRAPLPAPGGERPGLLGRRAREHHP